MKKELLRKIESEIFSKEKPLLNPKNNREYWLFTEYWQMVSDFFDEREKNESVLF